jgi:hypothetical protein
MGRIANVLDLPLNQKFLIASACLSVEFLSQLAVERAGETEESVMEQTLEFVKKHFAPEISESEINSVLTKFLESYDSLIL